MEKILFHMDDIKYLNNTEYLNKKYSVTELSDFLNKKFQQKNRNELLEISDSDFLKVLHDNYNSDCFHSKNLPEGVLGSYADFAEDFKDFREWQNKLLYKFAKADADIILAENFLFFRFSDEQKKKWFSDKYQRFCENIATINEENFSDFTIISTLQESLSSSDTIVSYVMDGINNLNRLDDIIRIINPNEWYVIENAIKLYFDEEN